jgi:DNA invertase Pin-like site-specific DNA recombinase
MKAVACYIRVSEYGPNQAGQRREINRWLKGNGLDPKSVRWYIDKSTGDSPGRPKFDRLQADILNGEVGTIVIWRFDRLSPTMRHGLEVLCDWCANSLRIVSVSQQIDFKGRVGKTIASVLRGVAEMDEQTRGERTKAGLASARARGRAGGRPKLAADEATVLKVKELQKDNTLNITDICKRLKISRSTYYRYVAL